MTSMYFQSSSQGLVTTAFVFESKTSTRLGTTRPETTKLGYLSYLGWPCRPSGSSRPSTSTAYKVFNGLVAGVTFCLCSPSQRTARAGIAQLTRQQLSELCESKSKKSKAPKESKDFLWTVFWSSLRAGISPFEFSEAAKAAKAKVKGVAKGARVATVALNEKQREALKALRLFDDIFAEALKTEAVKVCEAFELKQLEDEVKEVNAVNDEVLVQLTSTKQDQVIQVAEGAEVTGSSSTSSTTKFLLRLHDGLSVESVLIPPKSYDDDGGAKVATEVTENTEISEIATSKAKSKTISKASKTWLNTKTSKTSTMCTTICISSQVGCAQGCRFCRTGHMGLLRNLEAEEMIAQVVHGRRLANELGLPKVLKVVFMGMGEPLANLENVKLAVETLSDLHRMGFARKRIQISTVAPSPAQILELEGLRCGLVWSVHSASDFLRRQLVPTSRYSMVELRNAFAQLLRSGNGPDRFMVAVVMIAGVNDTAQHACELAEFLRPLYDDPAIFLSVNLIPYNQNPQDDFFASDEQTIQNFRQRINEVIPSLAIHIRQTRGAEASAACGQLATWAQKSRACMSLQ